MRKEKFGSAFQCGVNCTVPTLVNKRYINAPSPGLLTWYNTGGVPGFTRVSSTQRGNVSNWKPDIDFHASGQYFPSRGNNNPNPVPIFGTNSPIPRTYYGKKAKKIHRGPRGGRYIIKKGNKIYI
jgi:hypothetical protein